MAFANSDIADSLFLEAVEAIDSGNLPELRQLLAGHPQLASKRLEYPTTGYFKHPYLLWFIADNPIRHDKLPDNIDKITELLIKFVRQNALESFQEQMDYTIGLVESGRIPRECGVQIDLIDLLIDNGAAPGDAQSALTNGNIDAAKHIIGRTGKLTLTAATCFGDMDAIKRLLPEATMDTKQVALIAAAFYGRPEIVALLIKSGVDVNVFIKNGFHTHASALHQAVASGSLATVKILVDARAHLGAKDKIYNGTPLDWAVHMQDGDNDELTRKKYLDIEAFLSTASV